MLSRQINLMTQGGPENPWESPPPSSIGNRSGQSGDKKFPPRPQPGRNGGKTPPPLPPFLNEFKNLFGNDASPGRTFSILASILVLMWLASGLYRVQPEENAVVLRLGKFTGTIADSGLHYHLPWPFEQIIKENVTFERRIEIGYQSSAYSSGKEDKPEESMMLTGDANIANIDFVVQWKVSDAKEFLFNIREPESTLKRVAESAMREVVGQNTLQDATTDRREDIAARVKKIMQEIMNSYGSGIMITQVLIQEASVPSGQVFDAFEDVNKARQEAETMKNQAMRYRNEIIPRAQGEAIRLVKDAEGYKQQIVSQAKGDAQRFIDIYKAYSQSKDVTRQRLYIEAWENILKSNSVILLDSDSKGGALPYLNLNDLRNKKDEASQSLSQELSR